MINIYEQIVLKPFDKNINEYEQYIKGLYDTLGYVVEYKEFAEQSDKVINSFSDFIISLNQKKEKRFMLNLSLFGQKGFLLFVRSKQYKKPTDNLEIILSLLLAIPTVMSNVLKIKSVTDDLYNVAGQGAIFKDDKIIFKMDQLEGYIETAFSHLKDIGLDIQYNSEENTIEIPYGNLVFRQFSVKEIVLIVSSILSVFKFVYAQNVSGKDFNKKFKIIEDLEKWKKSRKCDLSLIERRIASVDSKDA